MDEKAATISKGIRISARVLIPIAYFCLTYADWWTAPVASALIVLLASLAWPGRGLDAIGLRIPLAQIGVSLLILCIVAVAAGGIIPTIAASERIAFTSVWESKKWAALAHTVGQTLNEEIVLGALLLKSIRKKAKSAHPCVTSAVVALAFALAHYLFYHARPPGSWNYGTLSVATLVSLFAIGMVRNNCILSTGNVGYAWALHLGWNAVFVNSTYTWPSSNTRLAEPAMFNVVLGNTAVVAISLALMGLSLLLFTKSAGRRTVERRRVTHS
jgi:hypothetical protein